MASLREWLALSLSALLFSVVAGYGVGRALNAKNDSPQILSAAPAVAIVDRTGEPVGEVGVLSASEMEMPTLVSTAPPVEPIAAPIRPAVEPTSAAPQAPKAQTASSPPSPALTPATSVAAPFPGERASIVISLIDQRLYLMIGDRQSASYRVKFGFDPARVKPGATQVNAKHPTARTIDLGWKSFPVTAAGDRGFILSPADFDALSARVAVGAAVTTTREKIGGGSSARATQPAASPVEPAPVPIRQTPANDAEAPAYLAAAPRNG